MSYLSGQPLYCYELALELKRIGHDVEMRSDWNGFKGNDGHKLKENLLNKGVKCTEWDDEVGKYDLWLASEDVSMRVKSDAPMINIIHSEYDCESPIQNRPFAWVAIRPSILEHIVESHSIPRDKCFVVYNGVDRDRFKRAKRHKGQHRLTVVPCTFDYLREKFIRHCESLANEDNHYHFYGSNHGVQIKETDCVKVFPDTFNIESKIAEADCVYGILLGRVNLESNSCGVISRIYDPVTLENEIFLMNEEDFDKRHNIKNVAKELLKIYDDFIR